MSGRLIWNDFQNKLAMAIVLAAIYITLNLLLEWLASWLERRMSASGAGTVEIVAGQVQAGAGAGRVDPGTGGF